MLGMRIVKVVTLAVGLSVAGASQAMLYDRGGGLIYNDVLNITITKDANLFNTQSDSDPSLISNIIANIGKVDGHTLTETDYSPQYNPQNGAMSFWGAQAWIQYLNLQNYNGYSNWRMPSTSPINGTDFNYIVKHDGTSDRGFRITSSNSELAYLSNVELGNIDLSWSLPDGTDNPDRSSNVNASFLDAANSNVLNSFINLQSPSWYGYWSQPTAELDLYYENTHQYGQIGRNALFFGFGQGIQMTLPKEYNHELFAWAVRDGDVAATIPEPPTLFLLIAGFISAILSNKKIKSFNHITLLFHYQNKAPLPPTYSSLISSSDKYF